MINITTPEFNNLAADVFNVRLVQANPEKKADFDNTVPSLDSKITTNKTISVSIENLLKKTTETWFELFSWQEPFWRRWRTKLFSILTNKQIF